MKAENFKIIEQLHQFPDTGSAYRKELNIIDWFGNGPRYDIRGWSDDHTKMTKGISLTESEFRELIEFGIQHLKGIEHGNV